MRSLTCAALTLAMALAGSPASAEAVRHGSFDGASIGVATCVTSAGGESFAGCLIAVTQDGVTRVTFQGYNDSETLADQRSYFEDATVTDAVVATSTSSGLLLVHVETTLPRTGAISLELWAPTAGWSATRSITQAQCGMNVAAAVDDGSKSISSPAHVEGTIAGHAVSEPDLCSFYWVREASGTWAIAAPRDEGLLPSPN